MVKTVVVLGASYAGLAVSHRLLKYTRQKQPDLRVVLVSKVSSLIPSLHELVRLQVPMANYAPIREILPSEVRRMNVSSQHV